MVPDIQFFLVPERRERASRGFSEERPRACLIGIHIRIRKNWTRPPKKAHIRPKLLYCRAVRPRLGRTTGREPFAPQQLARAAQNSPGLRAFGWLVLDGAT